MATAEAWAASVIARTNVVSVLNFALKFAECYSAGWNYCTDVGLNEGSHQADEHFA